MFFTPNRRRTPHRLLGNRGRDERARREFATSLLITGGVQVALASALLTAGIVAFQAVQAHARDVDASLRLGLPGLFVLGAAITARSAIRNLRLGRSVRPSPAEEGNPPDSGPER